uniref:Neuropeptide S n=1 Tax=Molossus molossus TaxID=27622 RepID=A0A7J8DQV9_MOLMO|nr:neuropeptide S [Molossus molossus]
MISSLKFNLILVLSVTTMHVAGGYPAPSLKVPGSPHHVLTLLPSFRTRADRGEGLDFPKPLSEKVSVKRSFRNGVGTGLKKTPFPRAKS